MAIMSLNLSSRRVLLTGLRPATCSAVATTQCLVLRTRPQQPQNQPQPRPAHSCRSMHTTTARPISWRSIFGRRKKPTPASGDISEAFGGDLGRASTRQELRQRMTNPGISASPFLAGDMKQSNVDEEEVQEGREGMEATKEALEDGEEKAKVTRNKNILGTSLLQSDLQRAIDPDPRSRVRWERKKVIQHVARMLDPAGTETRDEKLARTERTLLHKSMPIPTSTKKLVHLARQIAGKTLEEALVQMQFSKKKMAKEVKWYLEEARDIAVVERGMGLGRVQKALQNKADGAEEDKPIRIQTKDGQLLSIADPTRIYIDQAWVGKGEWRAATPEYRARGRRNMRWSPSTYLSIVLKEEKTRIRQHGERLEKEAKKAPWVHLPNRPVTAQRPYYSW
ncbi:mitochondrial large ribosomal subunit [Ophiostoma piceae UAMH 11346]|uniref:Mitochondrial large ribosomal subunit n=1 Tax=Ophiostoma piceae (strain UAMH 11346) TaxID=1262450 RepID=S3C519_OPHP1|nr:mitochondrial large ribosomal subunit [Ophiostoma piceae UAMH 11346]